MAAILDWAENRHDQSISESDIRQIAEQAASMESPEKQRRTIEKSSQSKVYEPGDVLSTPLPRLEEARRAEEGRTRGPDPSSLAIVSGVAHAVIRRVTVERRLLGGQDQPGYGQFQARKAETKAAKAVKELCPLRSGRILMRKQ